MNILVMGSDSRGATEADAAGGTPTNQRADTLMLMHIPADRKNIYTMSIMRDLWVDIPGHGEAKINSALALGGTPLMVQTIESIFHQRIDHVAMIDFEGFKGLTDALGGVTVNIKVPFTSDRSCRASPSPRASTPSTEPQALAFVRERHAYADGDYQRVRNQQEFLRAIIKKSTAGQTLSNPITINNMVGAVSPFVTVDKTLIREPWRAGVRAQGHPGAEHRHVHAADRGHRNVHGRPVDRADRPGRHPEDLRGDGLGHPGRVRRGEQVRERELTPAK